MLSYPSKLSSFCLTTALSFFSICGFCAQSQLSEFQKQARAYRAQGWELQKEGNIDDALSYYQKAVLLDPGYPVAYNDVGIIFEAKGELERAKQMYLKAIEIAPDYPNSYFNLALLYEEQGDYANAVVYWLKRAMLGGPQDPWAEAARKRLEDIARIYPKAYCKIGEQYKENLRQLEVSLFGEDTTLENQGLDNKAVACDYLARAKESFSRGEYTTALKEATVAEYLDSSNKEISAFVEQVSKALLQ